MSGGGFGDFGLGDIAFDAIDLGSIVTDFGTEFMTSLDITSFDIGLGDVASLGGFDIAGSFAGSASWFDTFNPGAILSSIPSVSDFSLPSLVSSLPALGSLNVSNVLNPAALGISIPSPNLLLLLS